MLFIYNLFFKIIEIYLKNFEYINSILLMIVLILGVCGACTYINNKFHLKNDNVIEEFIENKIKEKTGIDIDLSADCE